MDKNAEIQRDKKGAIIYDKTTAETEIVKIEEDAKARGEHKTPYGFRKYSYLPTIDPQKSYRITSMSRYEKAEILIEASGEFINLLRAYSAEARDNYIEEE